VLEETGKAISPMLPTRHDFDCELTAKVRREPDLTTRNFVQSSLAIREQLTCRHGLITLAHPFDPGRPGGGRGSSRCRAKGGNDGGRHPYHHAAWPAAAARPAICGSRPVISLIFFAANGPGPPR